MLKTSGMVRVGRLRSSALDAAAGLTQTTPDSAGYWDLSTTTAADQVQLLRTVAYSNGVLDDAVRSAAYELNLISRISKPAKPGVSPPANGSGRDGCAEKWVAPVGRRGWQVMNSIGHVEGDGRDYVIAVLTDGPTEAGGIATIQALSELIWQELIPATS